MNLSTTMSINILTVGGLNIQSQRLSGWGEKKESTIFCVQEVHFEL